MALHKLSYCVEVSNFPQALQIRLARDFLMYGNAAKLGEYNISSETEKLTEETARILLSGRLKSNNSMMRSFQVDCNMLARLPEEAPNFTRLSL